MRMTLGIQYRGRHRLTRFRGARTACTPLAPVNRAYKPSLYWATIELPSFRVMTPSSRKVDNQR